MKTYYDAFENDKFIDSFTYLSSAKNPELTNKKYSKIKINKIEAYQLISSQHTNNILLYTIYLIKGKWTRNEPKCNAQLFIEKLK